MCVHRPHRTSPPPHRRRRRRSCNPRSCSPGSLLGSYTLCPAPSLYLCAGCTALVAIKPTGACYKRERHQSRYMQPLHADALLSANYGKPIVAHGMENTGTVRRPVSVHQAAARCAQRRWSRGAARAALAAQHSSPPADMGSRHMVTAANRFNTIFIHLYTCTTACICFCRPLARSSLKRASQAWGTRIT